MKVLVNSNGKVLISNGKVVGSPISAQLKGIIDGSITECVIPEGVTTIRFYAFYNCSSLTSVTIPNSVTSISTSAFNGCSSFTSITIPDSVKSIGNYAFSGCSSLTSLTIGDSVRSIGSNAFYNCSSLESITVSSGNTKYHSNGNCLIETENKTLILGCQNSIIPTDGSVTSIGYNAFYNCSKLTSITIPNSVTNIGSYAFYGCNNLTSVTIGNSVTSIGNQALYCGSSAKKATFISNSTTPPTIQSNTFNASYINKIIVPAGCGDAYKAATNWSKLASYIEEATV